MKLETMSLKDLNAQGHYILRCSADYPAYCRYKGTKAKSLEWLIKEAQAITAEIVRQIDLRASHRNSESRSG